MRKCVSHAEAKPSKVQHKTPCSDCPFRRDALPGWLGGNTAEDFVSFARGDEPYPCHTKIGPQCAGLAIFRANICKSPRNPEALIAPQNKRLVFAWTDEFLKHHGELIFPKTMS